MNDSNPRSTIASVLMDIEGSMRIIDLWSNSRPSDQALLSQQPFCVDTLTFTEWLQFVFIERIRYLIESDQSMPEKCEIAPMAEEYFKQTVTYPRELISLLKMIDDLITESN